MVTAVPTIAVFPDEKLTLEQRIEKWVWHYCRTLEKNYEEYHRKIFSSSNISILKNIDSNNKKAIETKILTKLK